jgi:hypothetical protein
MTRFRTVYSGPKTKTINVAGGEAFKETPKLELVSILLTSFLQDKFYESSNRTMQRIIELIAGSDKKFAAKAAIYARNKYGMRSVSHLVAGEIAKVIKGETWTKNFFDKVVYRPDDMLEIVSYYLARFNKPIPNSLKKGLAKAFNKFDEYQLAKYRGERSDFTLVDLVNLIHPKPTEKNKVALEKLINGTLTSIDTWEKELTQAGQVAKSAEEKSKLKAEAWQKLIKERKIGYFALLRNLRNVIEQAPNLVDDAIELLIDEKLISKSLVLPFRFLTAYKEIEAMGNTEAKKVIKALNKAIDISCKNVPQFDGKTAVILDCSGSMTGSSMRSTSPADIGALFAALMLKYNDADLILFSDNAKYLSVNTDDSIMTIAQKIISNFESAGTNFHAPFKILKKNYNRIVVLSDMQGWMTDSDGFYCTAGNPAKAYADYKKNYNANPTVFSFNLNDYGTLMFPEKNVYCLAGWSDKCFEIMKFLESDKEALIKEIEQIEL